MKLRDIRDGTSQTILVGERAFANAKGIWAGAVTDAVCKRGEQNPCPPTGAAWSEAPTLVLAHSHLNNATTDMDGGLDDFSSMHPNGSHFVFADGAVHFVKSVSTDQPDGTYSQDSQFFQALGTRGQQETVPGDWLQ